MSLAGCFWSLTCATHCSRILRIFNSLRIRQAVPFSLVRHYRSVKPSVSPFFVSQPFRDVTLSVKLRRNDRSSGRVVGGRLRRPIDCDQGLLLGNGSVPQLVRSIMMISHGLRVSAIAHAQGFSLWMQFSTVQAIPLKVPSIQHLWDVFIDQQILLACTSDPLVRKFPFAM